MKIFVDYISDGILPEIRKVACHLILISQRFTVLDGISYHIEGDNTLKVVASKTDRENLFNEAHVGIFGGHLRGAKIHRQLSGHY